MKVKLELYNDFAIDKYCLKLSCEEKGVLIYLKMTMAECLFGMKPMVRNRLGEDGEYELTEQDVDKLVSDIKEAENIIKTMPEKFEKLDLYLKKQAESWLRCDCEDNNGDN